MTTARYSKQVGGWSPVGGEKNAPRIERACYGLDRVMKRRDEQRQSEEISGIGTRTGIVFLFRRYRDGILRVLKFGKTLCFTLLGEGAKSWHHLFFPGNSGC